MRRNGTERGKNEEEESREGKMKRSEKKKSRNILEDDSPTRSHARPRAVLSPRGERGDKSIRKSHPLSRNKIEEDRDKGGAIKILRPRGIFETECRADVEG